MSMPAEFQGPHTLEFMDRPSIAGSRMPGVAMGSDCDEGRFVERDGGEDRGVPRGGGLFPGQRGSFAGFHSEEPEDDALERE